MIPFTRHFAAIALLFLSVSLVSCKGNDQRDDVIDPPLRTKLTELNIQIVKALAANKPEQLLAVCNDSIRQNKKTRKNLYSLASESEGLFDPARYIVKKQFYEIRRNKGEHVKLNAETGNEHNYHLAYYSPTRKSFVTVGLIEDSFRTMALVTIFNNYEGEGKLNYLWLGPIRQFGKDAIDWYYRARQQYASDDLADAANSISICQYLLKPGGEAWKYELESDMSILPEQIKNAASSRYTFPMPILAVRTKPTVMNITSVNYEGLFTPSINYVTKLDISDTLAISRECDSLNAHIGEVFQGIDHNNKFLFYRAHQRTPLNDEDTVSTYGTVKNSPANWY